MLLPEQVKTLIEGVTPCEHVEVEGDGHHFFAVIVSSSFEGKARLARHRLIKDGLKPQLESNELHALSISVAARGECGAVFPETAGLVWRLCR